MSRTSDPAARRAADPRSKAMVVMAVIAALVALLQLTPLAPLPHAADDFMGGLAIGLAISAVLGWLMRD